MSVFDDALGADYLPPSPAYPIDRLIDPTGAALPANATSTLGVMPPGVPVPGGPPAQTAGGTGALNPGQILATFQPPQGGVFGPNTGRVMSALGAGLSSAGQNWNKPALAAFASGAGAALQGGQQFDNQVQDAKLKALHAAIAAWKVGDMAAFHQATTNLQALMARQQQRVAASSSAVPPGSAPPTYPPASPAKVTDLSSGPLVSGSPASVMGTPASASNAASAARLSAADVIAQARDAIARGAPPDAVRQRMRDNGFDSSGL